MLEITVNYLNSSNLFIYEGTDRHNASVFIEGNATAVAGAPYRIPASSNVILVMQTVAGGGAGAGSFSYKVSGFEYPIWEKPFLGEETWKWFAALIMALLVPLLTLVLLTVCICRCCSDKDKNKVEALPPGISEDVTVEAKPENNVKFSESDEEQQSE